MGVFLHTFDTGWYVSRVFLKLCGRLFCVHLILRGWFRAVWVVLCVHLDKHGRFRAFKLSTKFDLKATMAADQSMGHYFTDWRSMKLSKRSFRMSRRLSYVYSFSFPSNSQWSEQICFYMAI